MGDYSENLNRIDRNIMVSPLMRDPDRRRVLVVASTFPASKSDEIPAFVRDLVIALKHHDPMVSFTVLAPHFANATSKYRKHREFEEHRFTYFWPGKFQRLTGSGIMPTIDRNKAFTLLVPFLFISEFIALLKLTRHLQPDLIYAHWFTPQGINAAIVSAMTGVPWVLTTHASDVSIWRRVPILGRWLVRRLLPRAKGITAVSTATLRRAEAFFSATEWSQIKGRTQIIPMGVHEQALLHTDRKRELAAFKPKIVLFLGRLVAKKGVEYLLAAFAQIGKPGDRLIIAGSGPEEEKLKAEAQRLCIADDVEFVGFVSGARKNALIIQASVIVVPSIVTESGDVEGLPVVVLEALAAGKICIASDVSGACDVIVDSDNGFIVANRDVGMLADKLDYVLNASDDTIDKIGGRAKESSRALLWPEIAKRHHDFLFAKITLENS